MYEGTLDEVTHHLYRRDRNLMDSVGCISRISHIISDTSITARERAKEFIYSQMDLTTTVSSITIKPKVQMESFCLKQFTIGVDSLTMHSKAKALSRAEIIYTKVNSIMEQELKVYLNGNHKTIAIPMKESSITTTNSMAKVILYEIQVC